MILLPLLLDSHVRPVDKVSRALAQEVTRVGDAGVHLFRARLDPGNPALVMVPIVAEDNGGTLDPEKMDVAAATAIAAIAQSGRLLASGEDEIATRARRFAPDLWEPKARALPGTTAWDIVTMMTVTALVPVRQAIHRLGAEPADRFLEADPAQRLEQTLASFEDSDRDRVAGAMPIPLFAHPHPGDTQAGGKQPGAEPIAPEISAHARIAWSRRLSLDIGHLRLRLAQLGHPPMAVIDLRRQARTRA